jgi:hypothetical protein
MNAEITTLIGQLSIESGEWHNGGRNQVAVREPTTADGPGAGKGDLFIITDIQGDTDDPGDIEQKLAATIRDSYYLARGAVTASLRRAVQAGSDFLYQYNRKVDVEQRLIGGVVAAVINNEDAFVAQSGPSACFAILEDHIQRYPARSAWFDPLSEPNADENIYGIGLQPVIEPALHHLQITAGDMLVLADSRLAGALQLKDVVRAVDNGHVKASLNNLGKALQSDDGGAILLKVVEKRSAGIGPVKITPPKSLTKLWSGQPSDDEDTTARGTQTSRPVEPDEPAAEEEQLSRAATFSSTAATMIQNPLGWLGNIADRGKKATPEPSPKKATFTPLETDTISEEPEIETEAFTEPDDTDPTAHYHTVYDHEPVHHHKPSLTARLLGTVSWLGRAVQWILGLFVRGDDEPRLAGAQAQQSEESGRSWKWLRTTAIIIPLLVALIVGVSYLQKGRIRDAEYAEYLSTAQNKFEQAKSVNAPDAALALIAEAETSLVQAQQIKPEMAEITELRQQMADYADQAASVERLYYLPQVRRYTDPGTNMSRLVVQGVEVYALDTGNDRIFHHRLDDLGDALLPDDETVLMTAKGQQVDEIVVGDLLGMTWMPTGGNRQTSDLVILNSTSLLEYNSSWGITAAALAGGDQLILPQAVDSYFGNFYVLDPAANKLLRYLPTTDGYSAAPESYFAADQAIDLSNAVDMTIDGTIYILYKDGRIEKFLGGQPTEFNLSGLDIPLNNPVAIYTAPDEEVQYLYVADAGNNRIVQLEKNGTYVRQYKPRVGETVGFMNLQDVYVDEIGGRLFVLDNNNLYLGKVPVQEETGTMSQEEPASTESVEPAETAPEEVVPVEN